MVTTVSAHDSHPSQRMTTQSQEDSSWTEFFDPVSHPMRRGQQTEKTMDMDTSHSTIQPTAVPNTDLVEDLNRTRPHSVTTRKDNDSQSFVNLFSCFNSCSFGQDGGQLGDGMVHVSLCGSVPPRVLNCLLSLYFL